MVLRFVAVLGILVLAAAACGKSKQTPTSKPTTYQGTKGGTLKLVSSADTDFIDPGQSYYTFGYGLFRVTTRNLMGYPAIDGVSQLNVVPDAAGKPKISADGKTYTFTIKQGVMFGPPVSLQVTSKDFKYAIERAFRPNVGGQYLFYLDGKIGPGVVGAAAFEKDQSIAGGISGITTPDDKTLVFQLESPRSDFAQLLASMPQYAPVPMDYAKQFDARNPSTYGEHQVSSGPYMFKNDSTGNIKGAGLGWDPGKKIILVRNPKWDASTDTIRKAFPDSIEISEGFEDAAIQTDKILASEFDNNWDTAVPAEKVQSILGNPTQKPLLHIQNAPCVRYVALNVTVKPFDNVHVRRAVAWVLNKDAMRKPRGGAAAGDIATHMLIPGYGGFNESGGKTSDPYDTPKKQGDLTKALAEMKLAKNDGVPVDANGKYTGPAVFGVGGNAGAAPKTADQIVSDLGKIGIRVSPLSRFDGNTMYTNWYQQPAKHVAIAPNSAWCNDYPSSLSTIAPLVQGPGPGGSFPAVKNNNYSLWNDPDTNALIAKAAKTTKASELNKIYGDIDKRILDQVPLVPWLWDASPNMVSPRVKNYVYLLQCACLDLAVAAVQ
jgi:peptide/nickel transport system substrate-binding protein